jgi:hypothetical protein
MRHPDRWWASAFLIAPALALQSAFGIGRWNEKSLILGGLGLTIGLVLIRSLLAKVETTDSTVIISNTWRTYRLSWDQIKRFETTRWGPYEHQGAARLMDDRVIPIFILNADSLIARESRAELANRLLVRLNEELERHRGRGERPR